MSFNFADVRFTPVLRCDKPTRDGYEVVNLASSYSKNGFLAESFIKPPVTITVKFPCNIDVRKVVVNGKVGGQRSTGFEVYTTSLRRRNCRLLSNSTDAYDDDDDDLNDFNDRIFMRVGRAYDLQRSVCTFVSRSYRSAGDGSDLFELSHHRARHLTAVSALALRVTSTSNGSAVAVGAIEIWAEPAGDVPKEAIARLRFLARDKTSDPCQTDALFRDKNLEKNSDADPATSSVVARSQSRDVPSEFLDAITHEPMSFPVLLPCGESVDQTTLDRFIREESVWGRSPSDPFTGKTFSPAYKPLQNMSLKVRIDDFFAKGNEDQTVSENVPHILGRGVNYARGCSRLVVVGGRRRTDETLAKNVFETGNIEDVDRPVSSNGCRRKRAKLNLESVESRQTAMTNETITIVDDESEERNEKTKTIFDDAFKKRTETKIIGDNEFEKQNETKTIFDNESENRIETITIFDDELEKQTKTKTIVNDEFENRANSSRSNNIPSINGMPSRNNGPNLPRKPGKGREHGTDYDREPSGVGRARVGGHEDSVSLSLDAALKSTLSRLPSFTKKSDVTVCKNDRFGQSLASGCTLCRTGEPGRMYRLKCGHLVCRQCLLSIMKAGKWSSCDLCGTPIVCCDAVKVHLTESDFLL